MEKLVPKDHGEEIAVFRSQVIGPLVHRALTRGELRAALVELASRPVRLPGSDHTRSLSVPTLERWYYRFKKRGLAALVPTPRSDRAAPRRSPLSSASSSAGCAASTRARRPN
jgi:hypothetical protein